MTDAARREQILEAAYRLLKHYGPNKTTVADVAREAGVGVGSVYLEFSSKEAIIEALSRARYDAVLSAMRAAATAPSRSYEERLSGLFDARLEAYLTLADEGVHACDLVHCMKSAVQSVAQRFHEAEHALLATLLREALDARAFELASPEESARALLRAYISFAPPWLSTRAPEEQRKAILSMHGLVLHGLVRHTESAARGCSAPRRARKKA